MPRIPHQVVLTGFYIEHLVTSYGKHCVREVLIIDDLTGGTLIGCRRIGGLVGIEPEDFLLANYGNHYTSRSFGLGGMEYILIESIAKLIY